MSNRAPKNDVRRSNFASTQIRSGALAELPIGRRETKPRKRVPSKELFSLLFSSP
jgi:hypothetical protein